MCLLVSVPIVTPFSAENFVPPKSVAKMAFFSRKNGDINIIFYFQNSQKAQHILALDRVF